MIFLGGQNVLRNTLLLTASGVIAKTIDFMFRAYYTQKLGSEGMGIFSLVFAVHGIMLNVSSGGMGVAVSKIVSEHYARCNGGSIRRTMRIALGLVAVLSFLVISMTYAFSEQIANDFLKEGRCQRSIVMLSPSILFMGMSYCIKGYFYASRKVLRPASSEFLEQLVKILSIRILLEKWLPYGVQYGCEAVALGMSIGEASSCLYLLLLYSADSRHLSGCAENGVRLGTAIARTAFPVMTASLASSFLRMQEEVLIVSGLEKSGLSHGEALSSYGTVYGMAMPLIVFPLSLLSSFLTLIVPEISRAKSMKSRVRLETLTSRIYRFATLSGFFIMSVYFTFASELTLLVYDAPYLASKLRFLAFLSPLMLMDSISCGILNGLGKQSSLLRYSLMDSGLRLVLIAVLIPRFGTGALMGVIAASNIFTFLLTGHKSIKESGISAILKSVAAPCISAAVCCFVVHNIFNMTVESVTNVTVSFGIVFAAVVYFAAAAVSGAMSREDSKWLIGRLMSS